MNLAVKKNENSFDFLLNGKVVTSSYGQHVSVLESCIDDVLTELFGVGVEVHREFVQINSIDFSKDTAHKEMTEPGEIHRHLQELNDFIKNKGFEIVPKCMDKKKMNIKITREVTAEATEWTVKVKEKEFKTTGKTIRVTNGIIDQTLKELLGVNVLTGFNGRDELSITLGELKFSMTCYPTVKTAEQLKNTIISIHAESVEQIETYKISETVEFTV